MGRKKLNNPLFLKVGAAAVLLGAAVAIVLGIAGGDSPDKSLHRGIARLAQGRPRDSIPCFMAALRLKPHANHANLLVHGGDGLNERAGEDPGYLSWARAMWESAANLSPPYRPALDRLLASYSQEADLAPSGTAFQNVSRTAQAILATDPTDVRASTLAHRAAVETWLLNHAPSADDDAEAAKHLSALETLSAGDSSDPDLEYGVARARVRQGLDAARAGKQVIANAKFDAAATVFDPPSAAGGSATQPAGAASEFHAFQVDVLLAEARGGPATRPAEPVPTARMLQHLANALKLAAPDDRLFVQIRLTAAELAQRANDRPGAWRALAELLARRPDDWQGRLAAARLLSSDPAQRAQAIAVLDNPAAAKPAGPAGAVACTLHAQARIEQAGIRLDLAEDSRDPAERRRLLDLVRDVLPKVADPSSLPPALRVLDGRLQLSEGRTLLAIRDFRAVMQVLEQQHAPHDPKLAYWLAAAWMRIGQTGDARPLLEEVVGSSPDMPQARMLLAELLLIENANDQARPHIEWLEKQFPDRPEVKRLRAALAAQPAPAELTVQPPPPAGPSDAIGELRLADAASRMGSADEVVQHLQAAERIAPHDPRVLQQSFAFFVGRKAWHEAETYCAKLAAINADQAGGLIYRFQLAMARNAPEAADRARELTSLYPELSESWYAAGRVAQSQGDFAASREAYEQALKKQPTHPGALRGMAESYYDSPYRRMSLVAIKHARQLLPNDPSFLQLQLDYEERFESSAEALAARQEEVRTNPDDARNWLALCGAFSRAVQDDTAHASDPEKQNLAASARECVNAMLARWPEQPEVHVAAATVLRRIAKPPDAEAQLRSAIKKAPDDVAALNNLACLLLDDMSPPQPQEALKFSQHAYDMMSRAHVLSPWVCDTQGWALIQCGRIDEGVKLLEQTDAQAPSPAIRYHLAEAYLKKSLPVEAQRQLTGALALADEARKRGRPIDAALVARLDAAKTRVAEMIAGGIRK